MFNKICFIQKTKDKTKLPITIELNYRVALLPNSLLEDENQDNP